MIEDLETARVYLEDRLWPSGPVCPDCKSGDRVSALGTCATRKAGYYRCLACDFVLTGRRYSPRALAYLSDTTPHGDYTDIVLAAANNFGLIPYELWPTPESFTWESYYAPIPDDVLAKGEKLGLSLAPSDLNVSPLWTEIQWGSGTPGQMSHMVAQIDDAEYFDSEADAPIKPLNGAIGIRIGK